MGCRDGDLHPESHVLADQRSIHGTPVCSIYIGQPYTQEEVREQEKEPTAAAEPHLQVSQRVQTGSIKLSSAPVFLPPNAMLITPGLTPVSATLGALGVVAPALVWFVQPLLSARTHRRRSCESEDYFWNFGPGG